jgi:AmmeMemoRadiSam system protein B
MTRKPAVAGYFYPKDPIRLREQIEQYILHKTTTIKALAALCPHAGYMYSGPVAGAVYSHLAIPDKIVLLGPNHTGIGANASIMTSGKWITPLGEVEIDEPLAREILENSSHLKEDSQAHMAEHSIEVQIPFLQYFKSDVKIVPIVLMGTSWEMAIDVSEAIAIALKNKNATVISSSDMSHYEPQDIAVKKDQNAIQAILELDPEALLNRVKSQNISMCGVLPTISALKSSLLLGAKKARLISYMTSGDTTGDYSQVVGYAGIIII